MFILKSMELVTGKTTRSHILVLFILLYIKKVTLFTEIGFVHTDTDTH